MEVKRAKVIMLPTFNAENSIIKKGNQLKFEPRLITQSYLNSINCSSHHLYFTNDDEIKEHDWVYWNEFNGFILQVKSIDADYVWFTDNECLRKYKIETVCKKIIATTNKSLKLYESEVLASASGFSLKTNDIYLPQPSKAFIEKYCKLGGIDEVLVEYEFKPHHITQDDYCITCESNGCNLYDEEKYELKVDSHNTITIHPIKDSWNREEVESLLYNISRDLQKSSTKVTGYSKQKVDNWIEENLN